jgi:hypothetical protein
MGMLNIEQGILNFELGYRVFESNQRSGGYFNIQNSLYDIQYSPTVRISLISITRISGF